MIKGQPIESLFTISDTTPGQTVLWIMVIMVILLYILYQCILLVWSEKKVSRLKACAKQLREIKQGEKPKKSNTKTSVADGLTFKKKENITEENTEAMKTFETLKRKSKW